MKNIEKINSNEDIDFFENERAIFSQNNFLNILAESIAPEIFGLLDVKKALLLLLVGGSTLTLQSDTQIRGNIHMLLVGDPGVAKSQLLSFISRLQTRNQYTSGRGSTNVGMTASIIKNKSTKEITFSYGPLVIADEAVCCIDELDKMSQADTFCLYEAMESQKITIQKVIFALSTNTSVRLFAVAVVHSIKCF